MSAPTRRTGSIAWLVLIVCFLAQNSAMGLAFGSYGVLLASTQTHFGVSRALASMGISMITLAMGLSSPLAGMLVQRLPARHVMLAGATVSAIGYWVIAFTDNFVVALAMYGLIGIGVIALALLGPVTLISRWFPGNRAKFLGVVNLPLVLFLAPYTLAQALPVFGRTTVIAGMGTVFILLIPLLALLVERPPVTRARDNESEAPSSATPVGAGQILGSPAFWLLSLAVGLMSGSGSAFVVHFIPFATGKGLTLQFASTALSVYSGAGFLGILFFGWLADRIGAIVALIVVAFGQAIVWFLFLHADGPPLLLLAALLGCGINPVVTLHGATLGDLFGIENVGRAMGYSYMVKLPFLFTFAPAFGFVYDSTGNYSVAFLATSLLLAGAGCLAYCLKITCRPAAATLAAAAS